MAWPSAFPVLQRVMINLTDGSAIQGVLANRRGPLLVVVDANLHQSGSPPVAMDGTVYIEREKVLFIQATAPPGKG